jgi:hypothetical protein
VKQAISHVSNFGLSDYMMCDGGVQVKIGGLFSGKISDSSILINYFGIIGYSIQSCK